MRYRKKSDVAVEARQLTADNQEELAAWSGAYRLVGGSLLFADAHYGVVGEAYLGHFIVKTAEGKFGAIHPDDFLAKYEPDPEQVTIRVEEEPGLSRALNS